MNLRWKSVRCRAAVCFGNGKEAGEAMGKRSGNGWKRGVRERRIPLMPPGLLLIGHSRLLLTYFVPVTDGVDRNGYHISARMFNLDGVFYRKTADDLQYVGHIRRWTLDPVYLHESARDCEGGRAFSGQPGVRAAESACRSTGEGARFARARTAPGSSARLFRGEANACELVRLGERRRTVLPVAGSASLLTAERGEILSRVNPENDQEPAGRGGPGGTCAKNCGPRMRSSRRSLRRRSGSRRPQTRSESGRALRGLYSSFRRCIL